MAQLICSVGGRICDFIPLYIRTYHESTENIRCADILGTAY